MKKIKRIHIVFFIIFIAALVAPLFSQYYYYMPYYGKNKVMREKFDWYLAETPNFKIHYYVSNPKLIRKIAAIAEAAYEKTSKLLNIEVEKKIPILFYKSHTDFEQTNVYEGFIPPGAQAFAEPFARRMVVHGDLSADELSRVLVHELGHIFEYRLFGTAAIFRPAPLWVYEGFSDYITGKWSNIDLLVERDSILNDWIPEITKEGYFQYIVQHNRSDYNWGHFLYEFIDKKFGTRGVRQLLYSYRGGAFSTGRRGFLNTFKYSPKIFNWEFRKYVREKFEKFRLKENPEDYSYTIGPDFPYVYSFSHQLSPSGEILAVLTGSRKTGMIEIILISMKDGKIIKKITPGFNRKYDSIEFQFDPAEGIAISWDNKGDRVAFFARKELDYYFIVLDSITGKMLKRIRLKSIEAPNSPDFHPDNRRVFFTGINNSKSYIYSIDIATGQINKHSSGAYFVKCLNISPDGTKIVYTVQHDKNQDLYLAPIENPDFSQRLTGGKANSITPSFSADGKFIYYSCDELESFNLYGLDLDSHTLYRYTDVRTGNFFPIEIPANGKKKELVFSSFYKGMFHLFRKDITESQEKRTVAFAEPAFLQEEPVEEIIALEEKGPAKSAIAAEDETKKEEGKTLREGNLDLAAVLKGGMLDQGQASSPVKYREGLKYRPFKTLFLRAYTPVTGAIGTDGSIMGYTSLTFSDLMGDHNFQFLASSYFGYRSYHGIYYNQSGRLNYYGSLYYYTDAFYISYDAYVKIREKLGGTFGFFYPVNRKIRAVLSASYYNQEENLDEYYYGDDLPYAQFFNGPAASLEFSFIGDAIMFNSSYGPNSGHTFRFTFDKYFKLGDKYLDAYAIEVDLRKYFRLDNNTLLALRFNGFVSKGDNFQLYWIGGDNTIRATEFRRLVGNNVFYFNAEFRFPLIFASRSILGILGPVRGVFFFDLGAAWLEKEDFHFFYEGRGISNLFKEGKMPRLRDAISSYGFGLAFYMFGYPVHIDWVYQTDFTAVKKYGVNFWIGFDF